MHLLPNRDSLGWSLSLAVVLTAGLMVAIWIALGVYDLLSSAWESPRDIRPQLVFTLEGEPLLSASLVGSPTAQFRTLDGRPVEKPEGLKISTANPQEIAPPRADPRTFPGWSFRILSFVQPPPPAVRSWYLIQGDDPTNLSYFVGYDAATKEIVGYIGRRGYRSTSPPPEEQFTIRGSMFSGVYAGPYGTFNAEPRRFDNDRPYLFLAAGGELWKIDLQKQVVEVVPLPDKVVSVGQYEQPTAVDDEDRDAVYQWRMLVRLPHELQIRSMVGDLLRTIQLPAELQDQMLSVRGTVTDEILLLARPEDDHYAPLEVSWVAADGRVLRRREVSAWERPKRPSELDKWAGMAMAPLPLPVAVISSVTVLINAINGVPGPGVVEQLSDRIATFGLPYLAVLLAAGVAAAYAYRRQRIYDPRSAKAWAVFVFLFGPPALIGYLLHRRWPPIEGCTHCGRTVPRNRPACTACRTEFPSPAMRGIEVFA